MEEPKTIHEVCKLLDMTSRTIRYYEQCGLIRSIRSSKTAPRRLDEENIARLRRIRFLRKLGLAIDEISVIIDSEGKAAELIRSKTIELQAEVVALMERSCLLERVLDIAESGGNIYEAEPHPTNDTAENLRIAAKLRDLVLERRFEEVKPYLTHDMRRMPVTFFESAWENHIEPCGAFLSVGEQTADGHTVYNRLHYEKLDVIIKFDLFDGIVAGFVLQYAKNNS